MRDDIGLGSAMTLLDSSGGAAGSHLDDLEALLQVADLHPDAGSFEAWLRATFHRVHAEGGVTLSTIHRVKGLEWDRVVVFGASEGIVPHRLAEDLEEERRVLHVGITRGRQRVLVLGDRSRPSSCLAELDGTAPAPGGPARPSRRARAVAAPTRRAVDEVRSLPAAVGLRLRVLGGYEGVVDELDDDGVRLVLDGGGSFAVRFGERVQHDGTRHTLARPVSAAGRPGHGGPEAVAGRAVPGRQGAGLRGPVRQAPPGDRGAPSRRSRPAAGLPRHRAGQARVLRRGDPGRRRLRRTSSSRTAEHVVTGCVAVRSGTRTLMPGPCEAHHLIEGDAMAHLDRTVWTAPVRNLVWVAAHFGHR